MDNLETDRIKQNPNGSQPTQDGSLGSMIARLVRQYSQEWWQCSPDLPGLGPVYPLREKFHREAQLDRYLSTVMPVLKTLSQELDPYAAARARLTNPSRSFAVQTLDLDPHQLDLVEQAGFIDAAMDFARRARRFDPALTNADIYQAGRNVWSMNFFQYLLGFPVNVTPAIFAYSLLYPYTDNYLDDPRLSPVAKLAFNERFARRLSDAGVNPLNLSEEKIFRLVEMVEDQFPRTENPLVYESLLEIHRAQGKSLRLMQPNASPYEIDVLGISFEKGGAATLADGYLVAGSLDEAQRDFMFGYGAFTQLMDDQEDVRRDLQAGVMTIFSQTAQSWPLDAITNRLFHFSRQVMARIPKFAAPQSTPLVALIERGIDLLLADAAGRAGHFYTYRYRHSLEAFLPFRFSFLARQRRRLERQGIR